MLGHYTVNIPTAPLRRKGSPGSPLETQLLRGDIFTVLSMSRGWANGQAQSPIPGSRFAGYQGYVPLKALIEGAQIPTHVVTALSAPVFSKPDIKSAIHALWPLNARFTGTASGAFLKARDGYVHVRHTRELNQAPVEDDFVTIAEQHMGLPYIWGGVSTSGLDCSGLVQSALRAVGRDAPRDSCDQTELGEPIQQGEPLKRGDLVFWKGHVGIMQDAERLLHANAFHMSVQSELLSEAEDRIKQSSGLMIAKRRLEPA